MAETHDIKLAGDSVIRASPKDLPQLEWIAPNARVVVNFYMAPGAIFVCREGDFEMAEGDVTLDDYEAAIAEGRIPDYIKLGEGEHPRPTVL